MILAMNLSRIHLLFLQNYIEKVVLALFVHNPMTTGRPLFGDYLHSQHQLRNKFSFYLYKNFIL